MRPSTAGSPHPRQEQERPIWLTEQGAQFQLDGAPQGLDDPTAVKIINGYTQSSWTVSTRITRFYYYQLVGDPKFDSGLKDYFKLVAAPRQFARRTDPSNADAEYQAYCNRPSKPASATC